MSVGHQITAVICLRNKANTLIIKIGKIFSLSDKRYEWALQDGESECFKDTWRTELCLQEN